MNANNDINGKDETLNCHSMPQTVDKDVNLSVSANKKMNGVNGGCDGCAKHPTDPQKSTESANGIRLLCDAVDAIEANSLKKSKPQMNGVIVNHNDDASNRLSELSDNSCGHLKTQTNSCCSCYSISSTTSSTSNCCCCRTSSPSSSSSATTSCCSTSSATLSCDINNKELVVHSFDDNKDIKSLTNRVSKELNINELNDSIVFVNYESERQMPDIMRLIQKDLSEPYSIYTYRYFIHNWPHLCFLAMDCAKCVGAIVCKLDLHKMVRRGYIAMLAVDENYRKQRIGSNLVLKAIQAMIVGDADEVVLETEVTNKPALQLYENLGFVRDKRLFRYYLNGVDALRLKLWLK